MAEKDNKTEEAKAASPAPTEKNASTEQGSSPAASKTIQFGSDIEIFMNKPAKWGGNEFVQAYHARNKSDAKPLIALLCDRAYTPRISKIPQYTTITNPNIIRLKSSGPMRSSVDRREYYAFLYEDTLGAPLVENDLHTALGLKSDLVMKQIVLPLLSVLGELRNNDIFHGSIRPSNIFRGSQKEITNVVLGDCLSTPAGMNQARIFEPIERALSQPSGRGAGLLNDDLYALGVTVVMLLRQSDSMRSMTEDDIIRQKIETSSFAALAGRERITGPLLEFLRGVLADDPRQRWTIDDAVAWADGRKLQPKTGEKSKKAGRHILFNNKKFVNPETLAMEVAAKPNMVEEIIENGDLKQWIDRSLEDKAVAKNVEEAIRSVKKMSTSKSVHYQSRLATRLSIALHPEGPLRYKGLSIMPAGIGGAIMEAYVLNKDIAYYQEIIQNDDFIFWLSANEDSVWEVNSLYSQFETCRGFVATTAPGYGLERCIYFLNPEAPCVSPLVSDYFLRSPEDVIRALEILCKKKSRMDRLLDRHILAFLLSKERNLLENSLIDINSKEPWRSLTGTLKVLSTMQRREMMEEMPGLCGWFVDNMTPIYRRFHDREYRVTLKAQLQGLKEKGDLTKIYNLIDDPETQVKDTKAFRVAMKEYRELDAERKVIEEALLTPEAVGIHRAAEASAIICFILSLVLVLGSAAATFGSYQYLGF